MKFTNTKRTLFASIISLVLCLSMLVGSTFAWFTDTASTGVNTINAGNLDLVLEYWNGTTWAEVSDSTLLFDANALWEPGHTEVAYLRVRNNGTLAFSYKLSVNAVEEVKGTNVENKEFKLSDHIKFSQVVSSTQIAPYANREDAQNAVSATATNLKTFTKEEILYPATETTLSSETYLALVVYMPTTVGNEANYKTGTAVPSIKLGVSVDAKQTPYENDSWNNQYDSGATYDSVDKWDGSSDNSGLGDNTNTDAKIITIDTAEQLAALAADIPSGKYAGYTINLASNIDLAGKPWTPINTWNGVFNGATINGNGYTIKNMRVDGGDSAGFISNNASSVTIKNLTFDNAYVKTTDGSQKYAGVVMGKNYSTVTIENVHIKNSNVLCTWQCGGFVGFGETNSPTFNNCSISDSFVGGYNSTAGAFFGLGSVDITVNGGNATNVQLYTDGLTWESTQKPGGEYFLVGHLYGKTLTNNGCVVSNVTVVSESPKLPVFVNPSSHPTNSETITGTLGEEMRKITSTDPITINLESDLTVGTETLSSAWLNGIDYSTNKDNGYIFFANKNTNITLDLGGKTLTIGYTGGNYGATFGVDDGATLTVVNGTLVFNDDAVKYGCDLGENSKFIVDPSVTIIGTLDYTDNN